MKSKRRKATLILLAAVMVLGIQATPIGGSFGTGNQVYGDTRLTATLVGDPVGVQGDQDVEVVIDLENVDTSSITFDSAALELDPSGNVAVSGGTTGSVTLGSGKTMTLTFKVDVGKSAETGARSLSLKLNNGSTIVYQRQQLGSFDIYEKTGSPHNGSGYVASLDISQSIQPEGGFASGQDNSLTLEIKNIGNTEVKNTVLTIDLPDGLSIYNDSNSVNLGYIGTGSTRKVAFPISVDDNVKSKNYEITAKITGLNGSNEAVSEEKVLYVPVSGSGASIGSLEVENINVPSQVEGQDPFILSFDVQNKSSVNIKNVKVSVDVPEGLLNQTRNTFIVPEITASAKENYSVKLFADDAAKDKAYTIKITLSSSTSDDDTSDKITEYASVYVNGVTGSKTPQLMVDNYSYGGTFVQAGDEFALDLGLLNTSARTISNIKVTVSSEDGAFIPVNSSNSFYIEKLGKKERINHVLHLSVKPTAEQKTTPLNIDMSYEDGSGNAFTSKDIISIPVMQETRLDVDDVIAPPELYAGMQSGVSVQFYNMGKTTLNNLRVTAAGDFDTPESTSYFVGNLESGKSDTYDFTFIPRKSGAMEGKITFTYEDASGDQQVLERPFSFQVAEEMPAMNPGDAPADPAAAGKGGHKALWIALGIVVLLTGGGIFTWRKIRKKRMHREMEIDE